MQTAINRYEEAKIKTLEPGRLLLMIYEGAINFTKISITSIKNKDFSNKVRFIHKTQELITELLRALDKEQGGDIAVKLEQLYVYMLSQLLEANISNDPRPLEVVLKLLEILKEGWDVAVMKCEKERLIPSN